MNDKNRQMRLKVAEMFPMDDTGLWRFDERELFAVMLLELGKPPAAFDDTGRGNRRIVEWWKRMTEVVDRYFVGNVPVETEKAAKNRKVDRFLAWLEGDLD